MYYSCLRTSQFSQRISFATSMVVWLCALTGFAIAYQSAPRDAKSKYAAIRIVDKQTKQGVPLVELESVNGQQWVSDNAGYIAFDEPDLIGRELFFFVRSHGYSIEKDGFGFEGVRITPRWNATVEISMSRNNIAERLCRLTGEGMYRDSLLLGIPLPPGAANSRAKVAGQDSVQAAIHNGKVYWLWGDTLQSNYPLGLFRAAGATTDIGTFERPDSWRSLSSGIGYAYFVDKTTGFARAMMPLSERPEGVIWLESLFSVPDQFGEKQLIVHFTRRKGLAEELEHGIAQYDPVDQIFVPVRVLQKSETWRFPKGHPIRWEDNGKRWLLFGSPNPNVRVLDTLDAVLDPSQYQSWTCESGDQSVDIDQQQSEAPSSSDRTRPRKRSIVTRAPDGSLTWRWQDQLQPVSSEIERRWIDEKIIHADESRFCPRSTSSETEIVTLHRGSVRWNAFRRKWVLIAAQLNGDRSHLGEVWYSESDHPTGPFTTATKIVTHERQSFYNVCHHDFLDGEGGRYVHFEGTYTNDFSGNSVKTPRYNYNQILYRLDLADPRLRPVPIESSKSK